MPFPLAHPAAVLPLRRFCPRWLNLPALILGSLSPDAAYLFRRLQLEDVSHQPWGIIVFCLPATVLLLLLLYTLRDRIADRLPPRYQQALARQKWRPPGSLLVIVFSILLGAATHQAWDSFTHSRGWTVEQFPALATSVGSLSGHNVRVCRILWYFSSFAGVALVYLAYRRATQDFTPAKPRPKISMKRWSEALWVAILVLPIELVHDLFHGRAGAIIVALLSAVLIAGVLWRTQARAVSTTP